MQRPGSSSLQSLEVTRLSTVDHTSVDLTELNALLGERCLVDEASLATFESDGVTALRGRPIAVMIPQSESEVVAIVRWCYEHDIAFTARGSGTSLSGGSVPVPGGIVIAMNRLNQILRISTENRTAIVQPGVITAALTRAAAAVGLHYAPDPSSAQVCTIGGNVAFNSGGAHCLKYGMTTNHVLGLRVVLGDGTMVELGSESLEPEGPDLVGLLCGGEGTLGIVTQVTVRLVPPPESYHCVLAGYDKIETAGEAVATIIAAGLLPGAMEIMDATAMRAAREGVGASYPERCDAVLIVELDGSRETVAAETPILNALLERTGAMSVTVAKSAAERASIWAGRKSVFSAVGRLSPDFIVQDGVVPRGKLGYALTKIAEIAAESGVPVANVFHAGDGNLHPLIMYDGRITGALHAAEQVAARIVKLCIELGGSITGEHGVGLEKREFLGQMFDAPSLELMGRIRDELDPKKIANRDKMFPTGEGEPTGLYGLHPLEKAGVISRM